MAKNYLNPLFLLLTSVFALSCGDDKGQQAGTGSSDQQAIPYPVITVETRDVTTYNSYPTTLEGAVNSEVRPKISGYIQEVLVKEGQQVRKGQTLFRIETQSLNQDAAGAKANVNAAQVEIDKLIPLVEKDIISEVQLESAKAKLEQAKGAYNSIGANIDYANVRSPVDGVVGSINFRNGALVSTQTQLPLTQVSSISTVYAYFSLNEKAFLTFIKSAEGKDMDEKIKNLQRVTLILANGEEYEKKGTIETIAGDINPQTGTISFRARFDNTAGILRNGGSGTIKVPQTYKDALVIPALSTFEQQGNTYVYLVQGDTLATKAVEQKAVIAGLAVVEGINVGDVILAKGVGKVRPGTKIVPQSTPIDSITKSFETVFK